VPRHLSRPSRTADGSAPGAYPELEARIPKTFHDAAPATVDSGRNCSPEAMGSLGDAGVDGIIVIAPLRRIATAVRKVHADVPVEMIAAGVSSSARGRLFTFSENQELGARMATQHLIDLGHRAIDHIAGPMPWTEAKGRLTGYEDAMHAAGLTPRAHFGGDWTPARGYELGRKISRKRDATAVFVANDQMAIGVLHAFAEAGLQVPRDISVVGFDDIPEAGYLNPALTTVRQDFYAVGQRAIDLVTATLDGSTTDVSLLPPELIIRDSTAQYEEAP